jgi:hypothetical protein
MSGTPPLFLGGLVGTDNPTGDVRSIQPPRTRVALTKSAPPDAVCCVPLLSRRVLVHLQNLVDELNHRPQSRLGSYRNRALRRNRAHQSPAELSAEALPVALPHPEPSYSKAMLPPESVQIVPLYVSRPSPFPSWLARTG